jgi:SAM-dependent methyltransferase
MTQAGFLQAAPGSHLLDENRRFYDMLWSGARLIAPERFNTWPLVKTLLDGAARRLEVAPGLRPRLPIVGTHFADISAPALEKLRERGAVVLLGQITALPLADEAYDLVCAFDIVEHVDDDDMALSELARVIRPGGRLLMSVPLHAALWTSFDDLVGHKRRYEPSQLLEKLNAHHFTVERSAIYGMRPQSSRLVDLGMWWMLNHRERAMWWYNRVIMPLGIKLQKELAFASGIVATDEVDEILIVCRKAED